MYYDICSTTVNTHTYTKHTSLFACPYIQILKYCFN